nr:hypothetical protein P5668_13710 [Bacillus subtilis]
MPAGPSIRKSSICLAYGFSTTLTFTLRSFSNAATASLMPMLFSLSSHTTSSDPFELDLALLLSFGTASRQG